MISKLHKMATEEDYKQLWWVVKASVYLRDKCKMKFEDCFEICESLYEGYVIEDNPDCTPEEAVDEDMTYWGD